MALKLFGPRYRNDNEIFLAIEGRANSLRALLKEHRFIALHEYVPLVEATKKEREEIRTMERNGVLLAWCKNTRSDPDLLQENVGLLERAKDEVGRHNEDFVRVSLAEEKDYLDQVLRADDPNILLDEDQRKAVLREEDQTLVIAGAGAGKTTMLEAKCRYLIDKRGVDPSRILVLSFTRKATEELRARFRKMGIQSKITTFHSLGINLIHSADKRPMKVVTRGYLTDSIIKFMRDDLHDESLISKVAIFFASYLDVPFDPGKEREHYEKMLAEGGQITMKSSLERYLEKYSSSLEKKRITMQAERVRSRQECAIANFLFINGVDYEYETVYPFRFIGSNKPYCPDFRIEQDGKEFWLEHFGICEDGTSDIFTPEELEAYQRNVIDKIRLHRQHGTRLIHTWSSYKDGRSLISHLKEELQKAGIRLEPRNAVEIYRQIASTAEDRYFIRLAVLLADFILHFKRNGWPMERYGDLKASARQNKDERTLLFLDIAQQCHFAYESRLRQEGAIDFEDMINLATERLRTMERNGEDIPYDWVLVDEYQDISLQRFNLIEGLRKVSHAKFLAVGDDWQSIFRFAGSNLSLFVDFKKRVGEGDVIYLRNTHRNSQELIDIAGDFVMRNPVQYQKSLVSKKRVVDPVILLSYDDSYSKEETPYHRLGLAVERALTEIHERRGDAGKTLLIGRYNFDGAKLGRLSDLFSFQDGKITSVRYPDMEIDFMTAHASKGLGYDDVILINGKDDTLGFPSKIEDDPLIKLVQKETPEIEYGEERRLFYVALTRTKNRVYIVVPTHHPSAFVLELKEHCTNIVLKGERLSPEGAPTLALKCPRCGFPLQRRRPRKGMEGTRLRSIYVCSNDPEACGFVTNDPMGGLLEIQKCPACESGYLLVKKSRTSDQRVLGCSNHKDDGTGCNFMIIDPRLDTLEKISRDKRTYEGTDLPLESLTLLGLPVRKLIGLLRYTARTMEKAGAQATLKETAGFLKGHARASWKRNGLTRSKAYGYLRDENLEDIQRVLQMAVNSGFLAQKEGLGKEKRLVMGATEPTEKECRRYFSRFLVRDRDYWKRRERPPIPRPRPSSQDE